MGKSDFSPNAGEACFDRSELRLAQRTTNGEQFDEGRAASLITDPAQSIRLTRGRFRLLQPGVGQRGSIFVGILGSTIAIGQDQQVAAVVNVRQDAGGNREDADG